MKYDMERDYNELIIKTTGDVFSRYVVSSRKAYFETTARYIKFDGVTRVCIDGDTVGKVKYLEDGEVT